MYLSDEWNRCYSCWCNFVFVSSSSLIIDVDAVDSL